MIELRPYFDAILAAPDDDAPRLALADALAKDGDARGEHIRLACELAKLDLDDPRFEPLAARCQWLTQFAFFSGAKYPFLSRETSRRGFVEDIECSAADFVAHADAVMRDAPIRTYQACDIGGRGVELARCAALARLRGLGLVFPPRADRAAILTSPHLAQLRELTLWDRLDSVETAQALAAELAGVVALRKLSLRGVVGSAAVPALVALVNARGLELDVDYATLQPEALIETLWRDVGDRVRPPRLPRPRFEGGVLELTRYRLAQIRALVDSGAYRNATKLEVNQAVIGDAVAAYIATCRAFPALVELGFGDRTVTDAGVVALATAVGLDRLESVSIGEGARDELAVSDAAVDTLARSSKLPALRKITRAIEHHVYASGATDATVTTPIKRDDGRVVESVVYHFLWP